MSRGVRSGQSAKGKSLSEPRSARPHLQQRPSFRSYRFESRKAWRSRGLLIRAVCRKCFESMAGERLSLTDDRRWGRERLSCHGHRERQVVQAALGGRRMATAYAHQSGKRLGTRDCRDSRFCCGGQRRRGSGQRPNGESAHAFGYPFALHLMGIAIAVSQAPLGRRARWDGSTEIDSLPCSAPPQPTARPRLARMESWTAGRTGIPPGISPSQLVMPLY